MTWVLVSDFYRYLRFTIKIMKDMHKTMRITRFNVPCCNEIY